MMDWWNKLDDYGKHSVVGCAIGAVACFFGGPLVALILVVLAGLAKELWDVWLSKRFDDIFKTHLHKEGNFFDAKDWACTAFGGVFGIFIGVLLRMIS